MLIKNDRVLLSAGMLCLAAAILLKRLVSPFIGDPVWLLVVEGVLLGVSIVFNINYLMRLRRRKASG